MVTKTRGGTATRPAARKTTKSTKKSGKHAPARGRSRQPEPARPPFWRRQARDLWAVGLVTLGVLLVLALWGKQLGPIGHGVDTAFALVAGWVRILLPLVFLGAGAALLFDRPRSDEESEDGEEHEGADPWRLAVGSVLGVLGICGIAELAKGSPRFSNSASLKDAGGFLGAAVGRPLHAGLGSAGAGVILVAVIFVAILVATGVSLATAGHAIGTGARNVGRTFSALWQGKPFVITSDLGADDDDADAASSRRVPFDAEADLSPPDDDEEEGEALYDEVDDLDEPDPTPVPVASAPARAPAAPSRAPGEWTLPRMSLLQASKKMRQDQRQIDALGEDLVRALEAHGVETRLVGCRVGPTVTRYELELGPGVKVARVTSLSKDIAYAMASPDVRILAPIPGKSAIGVEVPNRQRQLVSLRDILDSSEASSASHPLEVAMGRDIAGRAVMANLAEMPHILISGSTGSGKSSCMNSIITSILMRDTPDKVKLILVDPKRVELGQYDGLPHLLNPVVVDPKKAANALAWAVKEMERRYDMLAENGMRDITGYNQLVEQGLIAAPAESDRRRMREVAARALGEEHAAVEDEADLDAGARGPAAPAVHPGDRRRAQRPHDGGGPRRRGLHRPHRPDGPCRGDPPRHRHPAPVGRRDHGCDQGQHPEPHGLLRLVAGRQPRDPGPARSRAPDRQGRHAAPDGLVQHPAAPAGALGLRGGGPRRGPPLARPGRPGRGHRGDRRH